DEVGLFINGPMEAALALGGSQHAIALCHQHVVQDRAHGELVFDDQDTFHKGKSEGRRPKVEGRRPRPEIRRPKAETRSALGTRRLGALGSHFGSRTSAFIRVSGFGSRIWMALLT